MTLTVPGGAITDEDEGAGGLAGGGAGAIGGEPGAASTGAEPGAASTGAEPGAASLLSGLAERLEGFVVAFEPARFSGPDAASLVGSFARIERLALAGKTLAATRAAEANVHRSSGERDAAQWLAGATGESVGDARGTLKLGDALSDQPGVAEAFRKGKLSKGKATAVSGAVHEDPSSEGELLSTAESDTLHQVRERALRIRARKRSAEDEAARDERLHRQRSCRTWTDPEDGSFRLDARLTPVDGARLVSVLRKAADRRFEAARQDGTRESPDAYTADALVGLVCGDDRAPRRSRRNGGRAGGAAADPDRGADQDRGPGNDGGLRGYPVEPDDDRPTGCDGRCRNDSVHVRIDLDALRQGYAGPGQVCEIPGVGPISVRRAREVMGDALTRLVITDGVDVPAICNVKRTIPAAIGSALLERDPTCVVPGCDQSRHLQIDHWQVDFADDGPTEWWNLVRLCPHHHRLKTDKLFRLEGGAGHWRFVRNESGTTPAGKIKATTSAGRVRSTDRAGSTGPARSTRRGRAGEPPGSPGSPGSSAPEPAPPLFPHTE